MKLTVLVDNNVYLDPYMRGEPGFSLWLEDGNERILFDTGWSDLFMENAKRLGIDLGAVTTVVFSHGHNDHTTGFPYLSEAYDLSHVRLVAHPRALSRKTLDGEEIGAPFSADWVSGICRYQPTDGPVHLTERLIFLGQIPRTNDFESKEPIGEVWAGGKSEPDFLLEDSALVWQGDDGLFIITGCSHCGICNIIDYAKTVCGDSRINGIIGGFHLQKTDARLERTAEYLQGQHIPFFYPCHCVSFAAKARLNLVLPVREVGCSMTLEL